MTQTALPLSEPQAAPLREAYNRTPSIRARYTLDQALTVRAYEICLRCFAEALAKRAAQ